MSAPAAAPAATSPAINFDSSFSFPPLQLARVPALYAGQTVFVTGVTGMLGKVLVEKLIRSTPDVRKIYCLVRPREGCDAAQRLEAELFESRIWERLRDTSRAAGGFGGDRDALLAHLRTKIVAVEGDLLAGTRDFARSVVDGAPAPTGTSTASASASTFLYGHSSLPQGVFAISPAWRARFRDEGIDVVIHSAATVNFDEVIDMSVRLNIIAPLAMMHLGKEWRCKSYIHVSTCYVNAHHGSGYRSSEAPDPSPHGFDPDEIIRTVLETAGRAQNTQRSAAMLLERVTLNTLGTFPNTYTLTKHISERKVLQLQALLELPLAVVRPAIIGASLREPVPGWIDTLSAAAAVFTAATIGMLRILPGNPQGVGDIVPVDFTVNLILLRCADLLAWSEKASVLPHAFRLPPVTFAQSCTSTVNPLKWRTCVIVAESCLFDTSVHQVSHGELNQTCPLLFAPPPTHTPHTHTRTCIFSSFFISSSAGRPRHQLRHDQQPAPL